MTKMKYIVIIMILLIQFFMPVIVNAVQNKKGDINGDDKITAADLSLQLNAIVQITKLDEEKFKLADINDDNKLTAVDVSLLKLIIVGLYEYKGDETQISIEQEEQKMIDIIKIKVNGSVLDMKLEENLATKELIKKLQEGDITINANEYGNFEKVGNLGFSLPREDKNIKTEAGDIVLYQGNQISIFYNSNSWSYTKLGKIQNISASELKNILGAGDVTLVLSLK